MKIIYIGFAFAHHKNSQGGYHHIKDYLQYDAIIDAQWEVDFYEILSKNIFLKVFGRLFRLLLGSGTPLTVIRCIILALFSKNKVFHFIYAENSYKWLHYFKGKTNKIICTFHQPSSYFQSQKEWIRKIKKVDTIILMTEKDVEVFKEWTGKNNVFFIPHGVNCDFYSFETSYQKSNSILMVGNWLRDFNLAREVFRQLNVELPDIEINVVALPENIKYLNGVRFNSFSYIKDDELKSLYQSTKIVFFPLKEFTANNAILEAASCGCSILISSSEKNEQFSYFSSDYITFVDNDVSVIISKIKCISDNNNDKNANAISSYVKNNYSWENISIKTKEILLN